MELNDQQKELLHMSTAVLHKLYDAMGDAAPDTNEIATAAVAVLRSVGFKDTAVKTRRKLKAGGYRYFAMVGGVAIVDPGVAGGRAIFGEHPLSDAFRKAGREPAIEKPTDGKESLVLTCDILLKALTFIAKTPTGRHRDDIQEFFFKTKDLRKQLRKMGFDFSYETIGALINSQMINHIQPKNYNNTSGYVIMSNQTLGEWVKNRCLVTDLMAEIYSVYVKSTNATG